MTTQAEQVAQLRRGHATVMEGHCPRCLGQLQSGLCAPCGLRYSASAQDGRIELHVELVTWDGMF